MAIRPTKTGSAGNQFAGAPTPLPIADLDADLNQIYSNITNVNVAVGAAIATAKLASDAGIVSGMLGTQSVTTAKLGLLAVTTATIAAEATLSQRNVGTFSAVTVFPNTTEITVLTVALTPRGTKVLVLASIDGQMTPAVATQEITLRVRRGGTLIATMRQRTGGATGPIVPWSSALPILDLAATAGGANSYTLTAQITVGSAGFHSYDTAILQLVEFA